MKTRIILSLFAILLTACAKTTATEPPIPTAVVLLTSEPSPIRTATVTPATATLPSATLTSQEDPTLTATAIPTAFCQPPGWPGTIQYENTDSFGDGFIARVPIRDFAQKSKEELVTALVTQWLEHYKTQSQAPTAAIKDFALGQLFFQDVSCNPFFEIVARVRFSIIPNQTPNDYASFPGDAINPNDVWWHIEAPFGIFRDGDFYRLRLVFGWGT